VLAQRGHYSLASEIAFAALGAIVGYRLGRHGGRALLGKTPIVRELRARARAGGAVLPEARPEGVFIGRFLAVLRVTVAWIASSSRMPWRRLISRNAAGWIVCRPGSASSPARWAGRRRRERPLRPLCGDRPRALLVLGFFALRRMLEESRAASVVASRRPKFGSERLPPCVVRTKFDAPSDVRIFGYAGGCPTT
jgi:hypothetical protein